MRRSKLAMPIVTLALLLAGIGLATAPSASKLLEPMVLGWERIFRVDWQAKEGSREPVLQGYLVNDSPYIVTRIQLLVESLDQSGNVVGQRVAWMPGSMQPFDRRYFSEAAPGLAPAYRVRVFAFDRIEHPSRDD